MFELTCFCKAGKSFAEAKKLLTKAEKFSAQFDAFRLKHFMVESELDVTAFLQVTTGSRHNSSGFGRDLHNRDHDKLFDSTAVD